MAPPLKALGSMYPLPGSGVGSFQSVHQASFLEWSQQGEAVGPGTYNDIKEPDIYVDDSTIHMFASLEGDKVGHYTADVSDPSSWTADGANPVINTGNFQQGPTHAYDGTTHYLITETDTGDGNANDLRLFTASDADFPTSWTDEGVVISPADYGGRGEEATDAGVEYADGALRMYWDDTTSSGEPRNEIWYAESTDGGSSWSNFTKVVSDNSPVEHPDIIGARPGNPSLHQVAGDWVLACKVDRRTYPGSTETNNQAILKIGEVGNVTDWTTYEATGPPILNLLADGQAFGDDVSPLVVSTNDVGYVFYTGDAGSYIGHATTALSSVEAIPSQSLSVDTTDLWKHYPWTEGSGNHPQPDPSQAAGPFDTMTLTGASWTSTPDGAALSFNASNNESVYAAKPLGQDYTGSFTLFGVFRPQSTGRQMLYSRQDPGGGSGAVKVEYDKSGNQEVYAVSGGDDNSGFTSVNGSGGLATGTFHTWAARVDVTAGTIAVFENGSKTSVAYPNSTTNVDPGHRSWLGYEVENSRRAFDGEMRGPLLGFRRALSDSEVSTLHNNWI